MTVLLGGCSTLDLGDAPFLCNNGQPPCPEGYVCVNKVCRREGQAPPTDIGPLADKKPLPPKDSRPSDADGKPPVPDGTQPPADTQPAGPVVIIVSEFMADPSAALDTNGEWLELFNPGSAPVNINGWTLKDSGSDSHPIAASGPLNVPAKGYLVLGRSSDKGLNGGVTVGYVYSNFFLSNTEDEIMLLDEKGKTVDSFTYSKSNGFDIAAGASLSVKSPNADKNQASNWCLETQVWAGSSGDKGSPLDKPGC